jgi:hypothetical protein
MQGYEKGIMSTTHYPQIEKEIFNRLMHELKQWFVVHCRLVRRLRT